MSNLTISIVLLISYFTISSANILCPRNNQSEPIDGAYRDPNNCNIYYHCINGTASTQSCPPGYHFQIETRQCRFIACVPAKDSDCRVKKAQKDTKPISKNPETLISGRDDIDECEPNKNETVQHFDDCRLYYHCYNGIAWPQRCPTGYFFSPKVNLKRCVYEFCVPFYEADCPIDGQWSSWSEWSDCDGACGDVGIRERKRECDNPPPMNDGKNCEGDSIQTELCAVDECSNSTSFTVSLRGNKFLNKGKVLWTKIDVNNNDLYDPQTHTLNVKKSGFYFFSLSGTVESSNDFALSHRIGSTAGLSVNGTIHVNRTITREYGMLLSPIYKPYIQQDLDSGALLIGSENMKETSWSGFYYDTDTYLYATSNQNYYSNGTINFDNYQYNGFTRYSNYGFDSQTRGYFYVSFGIGANPSSFVNVQVSGFRSFYQKIYSNDRSGVKLTIMKSYILDSRFYNPRFYLYTDRSGSLYSSNYQEIYMSVIKLNESKPILCVAENRDIESFYFQKVQFNTLFVIDNFNSWNRSENSYTIPVTGSYFISINIPVRYSAFATEIQLRINGRIQFGFYKDIAYGYYPRLISNSAVFNLKKSDKLEFYFIGRIALENNRGVLNIFCID